MWLIYISLIVLLMVFSNASFSAAKEAVELVLYNVLPSLFPFFVLTDLLLRTGTATMLPSFLCGYPTGAITCSTLYSQKKISKRQGETLSAYVNNAGPAFVIGTIGTVMCHSQAIGFILLTAHLSASLTIMILFRKYQKNIFQNKHRQMEPINIPLGQQLGESLLKAVRQMASVGGYIIFFAALIGILKEIGITNGFFLGFLEITSGINHIISSLPADNFIPSLLQILPIISLLLGWSGLCIHLQIISILTKSGLRCKYFIVGKIFHALLSFIYTYLLLKLPLVQIFISTPAFAQNNNIFQTQNPPFMLLIFQSLSITVFLLSLHKKRIAKRLV